MDLWLTFLALTLGVALLIALVLVRSKQRHVTPHDRTPPLGSARKHAVRPAVPPLRRGR